MRQVIGGGRVGNFGGGKKFETYIHTWLFSGGTTGRVKKKMENIAEQNLKSKTISK